MHLPIKKKEREKKEKETALKSVIVSDQTKPPQFKDSQYRCRIQKNFYKTSWRTSMQIHPINRI